MKCSASVEQGETEAEPQEQPQFTCGVQLRRRETCEPEHRVLARRYFQWQNVLGRVVSKVRLFCRLARERQSAVRPGGQRSLPFGRRRLYCNCRSNFFRGQKKLTQGSRLKSTNVLCGLCLAKSFEVVPEQTADTAKLTDGFQVGKNQGRSAAEKTLAQLVRNTLAGSISPFPLYGHLSGETAESAVEFLWCAVAWYASRGIRNERVLTDDGACYRSYRFRGACREFDIRRSTLVLVGPGPTAKRSGSSERR